MLPRNHIRRIMTTQPDRARPLFDAVFAHFKNLKRTSKKNINTKEVGYSISLDIDGEKYIG